MLQPTGFEEPILRKLNKLERIDAADGYIADQHLKVDGKDAARGTQLEQKAGTGRGFEAVESA